MNIGIIGSRGFTDYTKLKSTIESYIMKEKFINIKIISGGARGADKLGETFAKEFGIPTKVFKPDWDTYGKSAGFIRNKDIVNNSDIIFAFWDGESKGTKHSIELCKQLNKPIVLVKYKED